MFMGQYSHSIDDKGRLIMPSKFRETLGKEFVMARGPEECLYVYPLDEWKRVENQVTQMALNGKEGRKFMRVFFSSAASLELDKQGRVVIPGNLKAYANLKKEVELIGSVGHIEVWDRDSWNAYVEDVDMDEVSDYVAGEGLIF